MNFLSFNHLILNYEDAHILDDISGAINANDRIGLIGNNGAGKSTLLKCLARICAPRSGTISNKTNVVYVPQFDLATTRDEQKVFAYLERHLENWWDAATIYAKIFHVDIDLDRALNTLSGGEMVRLNIAVAFARMPDVLLLDEPTNHMDLSSLQQLQAELITTPTAFVAASHNLDFLNAVTTSTWELKKGSLGVFGGNYDFYLREKERKLQSRQDQYEATKKQLAKEKASLLRANMLMQRKLGKLEKLTKQNDRSIPRIMRQLVKNQTQKDFGVAKLKKEGAIQALGLKLQELKPEYRKNIQLDLQASQRSGLLVSLEECTLVLPDGEALIDNVNLTINHGDRVAFLGNNGSGKTSLAKQLLYQQHDLLQGSVKYGAAYRTLQVDQNYGLVLPNQTLLANLTYYNSSLTYEDARRVLANLGFISEVSLRLMPSQLSGGEIARLAFAVATSAESEMLILDEPTNNLDVDTVEAILTSLRGYTGTLVVISHDTNFLRELEINKSFQIEKGKLLNNTLN